MKGLRGLWGRMIPVVAFLVLFVGVITANAYTISGTVTNNTGNTGSRVYLSVASQSGGNATFGVSIPTPGPNASAPFAIRGVPNGTYVVNAFLDSRSPTSATSATRHSNDPFGSQQVNITDGDTSGVNITLSTAGSPLQAPQLEGVVPGPGAALIMWDTPQDANGHELAYAYNVYWGSSANIDATNPATYTGMATVAAHNDGMFIQTKISGSTPLADLTTLYYAVYGTRNNGANLSGRSNVVGPVTIGAIPTVHPFTFSVSGTVTIDSGITQINGPLLVAVHSEDNGVYLAKIDNPGLTNNFTVTGVPNGSYEVFSLIDQNNDGLIWAGDYTVSERNAPMVTVNGADVPAPTSNIPKKDVEASVSTSHSLDASGEESYSLRFNVRQAFKLPVNVTVQGGQDVSGPVDLALSGDKGEFSYSVNNVAQPTVGTQYTLDLGYADGSTGSVPVAITAVLDSFPEPIAPKGKVTFNSTPNFSWAPPASPPASFTYSLNLNGNSFWWNTNDPMPSSQTSALFNFDGNAQGSLSDNASYTWSIAVNDPNGNQASKSATFFSGGSISGKVTEGTLNGPGIPGISVQLYDVNGNGMPWNFNTTTATNGSYTVGGLQAGTYRVCFSTGQTGYIARCYDIASYDTFNATNIPVTAQTDTPNINVALAKAATITGTVTASGGGAIQGVSVELRDSNGNWVNGQNQVQTDGNGAYTLRGIQTGMSFKLYFNGAAKGYIGQWYNGASDQEGAESITLNAGQNLTADAILVQGASITGTVTNSVSHAGIQGINVQLYDQNGSWIWTNSNITTGTDGTYTIGGLVSGTYKVCFNSGSTNYIGKCYDIVANEPWNATSIQLTAPEARTGIDAALVQGGTISGRVTNGTSGIQWVNVQLRGPDGNWVSGVPSASTQQDGNYALGGVPAGDYKVFFDGANTGYVGKWYNVTGAVADQADATTLTIVAGQTIPTIGAVLPQGGSISGTVIDIDTTSPISGINVLLFDGSGQPLPNSPSAMTSGNGNYSFGGLPDGNYKVCFYSGSTSYLGKCYNQLALDPANATPIQIDLGVNGGNVTGNNASLKLGATITGLVTNGSTPIPNINVQLQNPDGSWVQSGITDASGNYAIRAILAGDYKVFFDTFNTNYVRQWYNGKSSLNSADQITLVNGDTRNGVNAVLALAATITGKVINDSILPIPGSPVQLWDTNNNPINFTNSDQYGNYTFSGLAAGNYKVQFHDSGPYFGEWYNDKPSSVLADAVAVTAGQITTLADAVLSTRLPTTTTLTRNGTDNTTFGTGVSFTAMVSQPGATGLVRFLVDGAEFASSTLFNSNANVTISSIPGGTHAVTAVYDGDSINSGSTSSPVSHTVNKADQTITFDPISNRTYGDLSFPISAWSNSSLPVTLTVTAGPASINGNMITLNGVGVVTVRASQPGNGNYNPAQEVDQSFTVDKATMTVVLGSLSQTYDGSPKSATAITMPAGLNVTFTYDGQATAPTSAGSYAVVATINETNYQGTASGTLTIAKATPVISWNTPADIPYGTALGGTQLNASAGTVTGTFTYNPLAGTLLNVGSNQTLSVSFTPTDTANYNTPVMKSVTINVLKAAATVTLGSLSQTYDGTAKAATATTTPAGLNVTFTYNGSGTTPTIAGSYAVVATVNEANYQGSANGTLVVGKAAATLTLSNLSQTVDGNPKAVTVTTNPAGLSVVSVTYTGISGTTYGPSTTAPSAVGSYSVDASLNNANYQAANAAGTLNINAKPTPVINWGNPSNITYGTPLSGTQLNATATDPSTSVTVPGTFVYTPAGGSVLNAGSQTLSVIFTPTDQNAYNTTSKSVSINVQKAAATVTLGSLSQTYDGTAKTATAATTPNGLNVTFTYNGSGTTPAAAGSYAVVATVNDANYQGSASGTLTIAKAAATVTLGSLSQTYDGTAKAATAATTPNGLNVTFTYNGSGTTPAAAGSYAVVATVNDANYQGSASGTLTINKATPVLTWNTPADITYGTALGVTQLNASTPVVGNFTYTPAAGTVLSAGPGQTLSVNFIPTDTANYNTPVTANVSINVLKATAAVNLGSLSQTYDGTAKAATAATTPNGLNVTFTYNGSGTTPAAAGSYAVVATVNDANYQGSANGTLTIAKATATVTLGSLSQTYDGTAKAATAATTPNGLNVTFTYNGSGTTPAAAGSYAVVATVNDANYQGSANGTLTIAKATATVTLGSLSQTYDGTAKAATAATTPNGLNVTFTYNGSGTTPAAAGSYAVVATVNDANYQGSASGTLTIAKAAATVSVNNITFTYDGTAKSTTATTTPNGLNVTFTYNGSGTTPTAAGSYAVVATVNDANYQGSASGTLTINKATPVLTWNTPADITYGTALGVTQLNASTPVVGNFTYTPAAGTVLSAGPGQTLSVSFIPTDTANYSTPVTANVSINVLKSTAAVNLGSLSQTYDGTSKAATAATTPNGLNVTFTYNGSGTTPAAAGSYAVVATVNDANYQGSANGTLTIAKATATVTLGSLSQTYDGTAKAATAATTPNGLNVTFTYNGSGTTPAAAGSYAVVATVNDANYQGSANGTLTIAKATATVTLGSLSQTYDGTAKAATAATTPNGLNVTFTYNGSGTTPTAAGSYAVVATVNDANYQGSASGTLTINKATPVLTWNTPADITYGTALGVTQLNASTPVVGNFTYTPAAGTVLSAGPGQTLSVSFIPTDTANYNTPATANVSINVLKATAAVNLGSLSQTYDGTAKAATAATTPNGLNVTFTYNGSGTTPAAAGSYAVVATVNDANYQGSANGTLTIAKATATVTLGSLSHTYDGTAKAATAATAPNGLNVTFTYNGSGTTPAAAGSYAVVATVNDANYQGSASGTLTIAKAAATVTLGSLSQTYDGTAKAATAATTPNGLNVTFTYNGSGATPTAAGSYAVVATVNDANYQGNASGTLTINQATATLTLDSSSLAQTYNGSPRVVTITTNPAGLTGVAVTYGGSGTAPTNAGSYAVVATLTNPNYLPVSATGTETVAKATPVVTWTNPADITYGTALGSAQLNATASTAGAFSYTPSSGTVLNTGSQALSVNFIPTDTANFNATPVIKAVTINVLKATPVITWSNPADLVFGTPLSATQLNATASVPGTFVYTLATGTVLDPGSQTLSVTFTPTDTANFATATKTVNVNVVAANGDANQDGKIGIEDALLALKIAVGLVPMDAKYLAYCDVAPYVNGKPQPDRKIDIGDALVILRKVVGTL